MYIVKVHKITILSNLFCVCETIDWCHACTYVLDICVQIIQYHVVHDVCVHIYSDQFNTCTWCFCKNWLILKNNYYMTSVQRISWLLRHSTKMMLLVQCHHIQKILVHDVCVANDQYRTCLDVCVQTVQYNSCARCT